MARAISEMGIELNVALNRAARNVKTVTAAYTMDPIADRIIFADATGGAFTVKYPDAGEADHTEYTVVRINGGANAVTVGTVSGNINGSATVTLGTQYHGCAAASDRTNYIRTDNL